jgi:hypothetical protein
MGGQDSSSNLAALQLAAMHYHQQQQQQQLACLALQQMSGGGSHHDSPPSPARSLQHQQQQTLALAAALHSQQQQQQAKQILQHQLSGQLSSPGPTQLQQQQQQQQQRNVAQLHLARSMPAALGSSVGSSCSSFGSQGQLQSSAVDLMAAGLQQQQQRQDYAMPRTTAAAVGSPKSSQVSPFALNQPAAAAAGSNEGGASSAAAEAAGAASSSNVEIDTVPPSATSLNRIKGNLAKKQLFRGDAQELAEHSLSMLLGSSVSDSRGSLAEPSAGNAAVGDLTRFAGQQASDLSRPSMADDTAAANDDALAAAYAAGSGAAAGGGALSSSHSYTHWSRQDSTLDMMTPDLLAALQHMSAEFDPAAGQLSNSSFNAAAIAALQHQQLLAAVATSQALQQQLLDAQISAPVGSADAANAEGWAMQLANMRARDARASDSQVLMGTSGQRGDAATSFRLTSPSLPGCYSGTAAYGSPGTAEAAAQAWQQAAMSCNQQEQQQMQQQQQQRGSFSNLAAAEAAAAAATASMPASQAFRDKHKQQLQLQLPEFDLVSAPLTSAQLAASTPFDQPFDHRFDQLITTEVMPDTPATAALQSPLNVQAAMLAATSSSAAASSALYGNNSSNFGSSSGDGSNWVDWNSMAALLSPMHVPSLQGTRRFTDCSVPALADHAGLLMQQEQQQLRQQHSRSAAGVNAPVYGRHSTSFLGTTLPLPGLASLSEQQAAHAAAAAAASSDIELFGLPTAPARCGDSSGGAFGRTRHGSLCLDARLQLPSFSLGQQQQQLGGSEAGSASNSSNTNARCDSDVGNTQGGNSSGSNAATCHAKKGHLSDAGAAGGLYSSGSFTFKPPVLQQLLRESRLGSTGSGGSSGGCSSSSSSSDAMITGPFQMPSFFRSSQQSGGSSSGGGSSGSPTKAAAAAAAVGVSAMLPRVSENGTLHQQQVQSGADSSEGITADGASQVAQLESSRAHQSQQEQLQQASLSMSQRTLPDSAAAAAGLEGNCSPLKAQQQQQQQQQHAVGGFDDVYRSLFGNEGAPSSG